MSRFDIAARVSWEQLPLTLEQDPPFSEVLAGQTRSVPAPVRLRLGPAGSLHLLAGERTPPGPARALHVVHLDDSGRHLGSVNLPAPYEGTLADFGVDENLTCYLLEADHPHGSAGPARLTAVDADGKVIWSQGIDPLYAAGPAVAADRLAVLGGSRLLLSESGGTGAALIDAATGTVADRVEWGLPASHVFADGKDGIVVVVYDPVRNRRGIAHLDLGSRRFTQLIGGRELFGWLLNPVGTDHAGNLYAVQDSWVAQVSPDGHLAVIAAFDAVVITPGGEHLLTSWMSPEEPSVVAVDAYDRTGAPIAQHRLALPPSAERTGDQWRLIRADIGHQYDIFGGERPGHLGSVYTFRGDDPPILVEASNDIVARGSRLQRPATWQVGTDGRLYLPVLTPDGVTVARMANLAAS